MNRIEISKLCKWSAWRRLLVVVCLCAGSLSLFAQGIKIKGTVTDAVGDLLAGANVSVKGTTNGVVANEYGEYEITVSDRKATLVFSFISYVTQEIVVGNRTEINVMLVEDAQMIEEVMVVGYGTTSKRKLTASVSQINAEQIENLPSASVVNNLGGRTPGIIVTSNGGGPNNFSVISIRGGGTPIVVIDGIVSEYEDFRNLAPQDIEELNILKDAAAAAIYGSRAGNGILMVTTKKGANKPFSIDYSYSYSLSQPTYFADKLESYDWVTYRNQAYENDGYGPFYGYSQEVMEKYRTGSDPYYYPNTDWIALSLKDYAPEESHNVSLRGGNRKNSYFASLNYYDQGSIYAMDVARYKRYNARVNLKNYFENIGLTTTTGISANVTNYHDTYTAGGVWGHIQAHTPMELAYTDLGYYSTLGDHPLVELDPRSGYQDYDSRVFNGVFQADWAVPFVKGLTLKSVSDYRMGFSRNKSWRDFAPQYEIGSTVPGVKKQTPELNETYSRGFAYTQQFMADYSHELGNGLTLGGMLGYEFYSANSDYMNAGRYNYELELDQFVAGPTTNMSNSGGESEYGRAAYIGRVKADYKAKYMLEAQFRRDGSDLFPKDRRWGTFYSFSGAWVLSDESFMSRLKRDHILDLLKLKGSYGIVGLDDGIERYAYVPGYNLNTNTYVVDGIPRLGFSEGDLVSPDITWYTLKSTNIGLEFSSLNNALFGGLDYFRMRTTGYLASPSDVGYTDPLGKNLPIVKSNGEHLRAGIEASLGYRGAIDELAYEVTGSFTYFDQLWVVNPNESEVTTKNPRTRDTHILSYYTHGYKNLGYYTSMDEILTTPHPVTSHDLRPGDIRYEDINGDGLIDDNDQIRIGKPRMPRANYGLNIDLKYRGFFFDMLLMAATGSDRYLGGRVAGSTTTAFPIYPFQTDFWTENNRDALYPRLLNNTSFNGNNNHHTSDFWLISGSYLRLKSLQFGYDFKKTLLKNVKYFSSAKLILSGTNLLTFAPMTKYYIDPESEANNFDYPVQRMYSFTINVGF